MPSWAATKTPEGENLKQQLALLIKQNNWSEKDQNRITNEAGTLSYDSKLGEITPNIGTLNPQSGYVEFKSGLKLLPSSGKISLKPLAYCEPFVQYKSTANFSGISSQVYLTPNYSGIDISGEAAYEYVGLYTQPYIGGGGFTEAGFYTTISVPNQTISRRWYAYHRSGSTFETFQSEFSNMSGGGIQNGTLVTVRQQLTNTISSTDQIQFYVVSYYTFSSGVGFRFSRPVTSSYNRLSGARTTSYLSNSFVSGEGIFESIFQNVALGIGTQESPRSVGQVSYRGWQPSDTAAGGEGELKNNCISNNLFRTSSSLSSQHNTNNDSVYSP